jgi:hypothetical protein
LGKPEIESSIDRNGEDVILQVMIPRDLKQQVALRAVQEGTTQRTLVLRGLRSIGFEVPDEQLYDRRKAR